MNLEEYYKRLPEELNELRTEVCRRYEDITSPTNEYMCCFYLIDRLKVLYNVVDYGCFQNGSACFRDSADRNLGEIHGYMIEETPNEEENFILNLFYVIYNNEFDHVDGSVPSVSQEKFDYAIDRITGYYEKALVIGRSVSEYSSHYRIANWICSNEKKISQIVINIVSNNIIKAKSVIKKQDKGSRGRTVILNENNIYDIEHLYRIFCDHSGKVSINIDFEKQLGYKLPCVISKQENTGYESLLAVLPGTIVYDMYDTNRNKLLENNVRLFLGVKEIKDSGKIKSTRRRKKVNDEIRETLVKKPHMFMAYNNGLAVTGTSVEIETHDNKIGYIKRINDFQIVNGGQTTVSIYMAKKANPDLDLGKIFVQMKVTIVEDLNKLSDEISAISVCSNRQNEVKFTDFSANNEFYKELERLVNNDYKPDIDGIRKRWYFERKTNSYAQALAYTNNKTDFKIRSPKERVFRKEMLAQVHMSWLGKPYCCSSSYASCFMQYSHYIDEECIKPDVIYAQDSIGLLILFNGTNNSEKNKGNRKGLLVLFSMALLHKWYPSFSLYKIYSLQQIPEDLLDELIRCSNAIRVYLRDVLGVDDIRNKMKTEDDFKLIQKNVDFKFDDNVISKYCKSKTEDKLRKGIKQISLPAIDDHNLVISFGRKFWAYFRDQNSSKPLISNSVAESICSKMLNRQIISNVEVDKALEVCNRYRGNNDMIEYINSLPDYMDLKDYGTYNSIEYAYSILEISDSEWEAKIGSCTSRGLDTKVMKSVRDRLLKSEYNNIKYEDLECTINNLNKCNLKPKL